MADDEPKSSSESAASAHSPRPPARRSRRGGRRHSRGTRGPRTPKDPQPGEEAQSQAAIDPATTSPEAAAAEASVAIPTEGQPAQTTAPTSEIPRASRLGSRLVLKSEQKPQPPPRHNHTGIVKAIEQVKRITEELRRALFHMEEVLDTLELADRQKIEDEKEIESLRRALRNLHEPRDSDREQR